MSFNLFRDFITSDLLASPLDLLGFEDKRRRSILGLVFTVRRAGSHGLTSRLWSSTTKTSDLSQGEAEQDQGELRQEHLGILSGWTWTG